MLAIPTPEYAKVFPTHVGVFPSCWTGSGTGEGLPHARGGVSCRFCWPRWMMTSSPRTWGCFSPRRSVRTWCRVFPTHVGVFPTFSSVITLCSSLPHARGGVSTLFGSLSGLRWSSPRTWGCFQSELRFRFSEKVFPTHVGVFPATGQAGGRRVRLPHARGGVSALSACPFQRSGLPHARGGVSDGGVIKKYLQASSPRTWGCFCQRRAEALFCDVFPTHVGVFPTCY